ncbi:hypothetical protein [Mycobacterium aquaticum]|uniref:hypothetical protein n=1 Tax=Mycobacterium aquaticum TaxID=1927124 RepID=UPI001301B9EF|nr:hypothetical protein [Mycobacterium aquaticum]
MTPFVRCVHLIPVRRIWLHHERILTAGYDNRLALSGGVSWRADAQCVDVDRTVPTISSRQQHENVPNLPYGIHFRRLRDNLFQENRHGEDGELVE